MIHNAFNAIFNIVDGKINAVRIDEIISNFGSRIDSNLRHTLKEVLV